MSVLYNYNIIAFFIAEFRFTAHGRRHQKSDLDIMNIEYRRFCEFATNIEMSAWAMVDSLIGYSVILRFR
jgi:hypothetical protein